MFKCEELFTLKELKRADGRFKSHCDAGDRGGAKKTIKEVTAVYPEILVEAFNSCLWKGRFFDGWKRQRLVFLRKGKKSLDDASSYRPICRLKRLSKRQVRSGRHPGSGEHRYRSKKRKW